MPYYEDTQKRLQEIKKKRTGGRLILRSEEIDLEVQEKRNNRGALLASPFIGSPLASISMHMSEIEPGSKTNCHRHLNEAIIHILSGQGYSIIDGQRIDWKAGDTICVPVNAWHQHFNASEVEPARYIACTNGPLMESLQLREIEDKI